MDRTQLGAKEQLEIMAPIRALSRDLRGALARKKPTIAGAEQLEGLLGATTVDKARPALEAFLLLLPVGRPFRRALMLGQAERFFWKLVTHAYLAQLIQLPTATQTQAT